LKIFYTDTFTLDLPKDHDFPLQKYALLRKGLLRTGIIRPDQCHIPRSATRKEICRAHDPDYVTRLEKGELTNKEIRRTGFPWSPQLVNRAKRSVGATIEASFSALENGIAVSLSGGTHHAFRDRGEGYCLLNDSVIAARTLQNRGPILRVLIIDCDAHQGNGTASMTAGDPTIFTFSIHAKNSFPYHKEKSDLDISLKDGTGDREYLSALRAGIRQALSSFDPGLALYLAGADPFSGDRFGPLSMSGEGLEKRDRFVFQSCLESNIPVAVTMAGGYAENIQDTVHIHMQTVRTAVAMCGAKETRGGW
jgi:acetoin utilization deacetylase AcuC-like enzyme